MTINADLLLNDADANSDPLTISAVGGKAAGVGSAVDGSSGGSFTLDKNGGWTFDPDDDFEDLVPRQNPHHLGDLYRHRWPGYGHRHPYRDRQRDQRCADGGR